MVEEMKSVMIVVLAWNHVDDTVECLYSMAKSDYPNLRLALVDNASTDNTLEIVKRDFPQVEIIQSKENLGVSGGYNLGMKYAVQQGVDYILIANNDISVDSSMIRNLVTAMDQNEQIGIGMPKIYHYYQDRSRLWCTGAYWRRFPPTVKMMGVNARDALKYDVAREIEFAPSCVLLLRTKMVIQVGYFDTGYFFYNDDWDYCVRARHSGYKIHFIPSAMMWHKVSVSTQKTEKKSLWWNYYGRSTVRYYMTYASFAQLVMFIFWFVLRESVKTKFKRISPFLQGVRTEWALRRAEAQL